MAAGFAPEQVAQLKRATDSLATLAQQVHSLPRRQTDARADLGSALLSAETEQSLRETEQIMATLRPHLERTERRLLSKIKQVGDRREQEADGGVTVSHGGGGGGGGHAATTIAGRPDDQVGDVTIDPSDPTWVPRTVFVGEIELASATAKLVKEACGRVKDGQERGRGTQNARALLSGASTKGDLIVSVSVRRKPDRQKGSWALVSFSTEAGAKRLLEEQEREVRHRTTGKAWSFHPYEPTRLQSHEAQARKFQSAKHAEQWKKTGLVGHVIASMKDTHKAAAHERTVWVGNIPDRLAREGFDTHMHTIFGRFGRVQKIQTRYKAAAAAGTSWCTVTFANASTAQKVLGERVSVIADGQPADGKRTVNLVLKLADTAAMDRSPVGIARAEVQIKVIQGALVRYRGYLPSSHPTLVRLHAAMARLQRQSKSRPFTNPQLSPPPLRWHASSSCLAATFAYSRRHGELMRYHRASYSQVLCVRIVIHAQSATRTLPSIQRWKRNESRSHLCRSSRGSATGRSMPRMRLSYAQCLQGMPRWRGYWRRHEVLRGRCCWARPRPGPLGTMTRRRGGMRR